MDFDDFAKIVELAANLFGPPPGRMREKWEILSRFGGFLLFASKARMEHEIATIKGSFTETH